MFRLDAQSFAWVHPRVRTCCRWRRAPFPLAATLEQAAPQGWKLISEPRPDAGAVGAWLAFETSAGRGKVHMRLRDGRCWTFFTALREPHGHEEKKGRRHWRGTAHHHGPGRKTWQEQRAEQALPGPLFDDVYSRFGPDCLNFLVR
jgi:hypothetical protein